ncbi:MAG TPA: hypothetical protein VFA52_04025 [Candidatus Paceibacterota bacterium]|jgi:hypothetical protein|nr:hypothetical protein [Candidatus Paceibacterota bacterium]
MARNVGIQVLRGIKANMPILQTGELYFATDEAQLYVGTSSGNQLVLLHQLGVGNGGIQTVRAPQKGTGDGPSNPRDIVGFLKIVLSGTTYWVPLMQ